jgi:osmotically-inducible protein OsmY
MRRAGQERPAAGRAASATPSVTGLKVIGFEDPIDQVTADALDERDARHRALEIAIQQRIESRLGGRVRRLVVRVFEGVVILEGECATFYTKQLAQHAAMGVLEDEHLKNAIVVTIQ